MAREAIVRTQDEIDPAKGDRREKLLRALRVLAVARADDPIERDGWRPVRYLVWAVASGLALAIVAVARWPFVLAPAASCLLAIVSQPKKRKSESLLARLVDLTSRTLLLHAAGYIPAIYLSALWPDRAKIETPTGIAFGLVMIGFPCLAVGSLLRFALHHFR